MIPLPFLWKVRKRPPLQSMRLCYVVGQPVRVCVAFLGGDFLEPISKKTLFSFVSLLGLTNLVLGTLSSGYTLILRRYKKTRTAVSQKKNL